MRVFALLVALLQVPTPVANVSIIDTPPPSVGVPAHVVWYTTFEMADVQQCPNPAIACTGSNFWQDGNIGLGSHNPVTGLDDNAVFRSYTGGDCGGQCPTGSQILAAAKHPNASPASKGLRTWDADGNDVNSGPLRLEFNRAGGPGAFHDVYLTYYVRYQFGYRWLNGANPGFIKDLYWLLGGPSSGVFGFSGGVSGWAGVSPTTNYRAAPSWQQVFGAVSDGLPHCFEAHLARGTTSSNGVVETKVDGVLNASVLNANLGTVGDWPGFTVGSNQNAPANGGPRYVDYSAIYLSFTDWIPCPLGHP